MNCSVGPRGGSDLALLWLCWRLAVVAPIRPLAWEPPHAAGVAPRKKKKKTLIPMIIVTLSLWAFAGLIEFTLLWSI